MHKIHYHTDSHMHCINPSHPALLNTSNPNSNWKPPIDGVVKFNVDGPYMHDSNLFGTGIVLGDHTGSCIGIKGSNGDGEFNS